MNAPISVMETAGEGGAWGMALLAAYMLFKKDGQSLGDYLDSRVFAERKSETMDRIRRMSQALRRIRSSIRHALQRKKLRYRRSEKIQVQCCKLLMPQNSGRKQGENDAGRTQKSSI